MFEHNCSALIFARELPHVACNVSAFEHKVSAFLSIGFLHSVHIKFMHFEHDLPILSKTVLHFEHDL